MGRCFRPALQPANTKRDRSTKPGFYFPPSTFTEVSLCWTNQQHPCQFHSRQIWHAQCVPVRSMETRETEPPRLLVDQMLARVARWLCFLGYDCELVTGGASDMKLIERARAEGRLLITRACALAEGCPESVLLAPQDFFETLGKILQRWPLDFATTAFSRCSRCNKPVEIIDEDRISSQLPERVRGRHLSITTCPGCGRLYWPGTHTQRLIDVLRREFSIDLPNQQD